jgi:hypothetical protein
MEEYQTNLRPKKESDLIRHKYEFNKRKKRGTVKATLKKIHDRLCERMAVRIERGTSFNEETEFNFASAVRFNLTKKEKSVNHGLHC